MKRPTAAAAVAWLFFSQLVSATTRSLVSRADSKTPPAVIKGNAFFVNDKRFYLRGLDYQPGGSSGNLDPLADTSVCKRDLEKFQQLGINSIRVYTLDNSANHDDCMKLLSDAGIYVSVDVSWSNYSLNNEYPEAMRRSYNDVYLQSVFATIDAFAKYDNLLAFFSANEVITLNETWSAPFIKAQIRDMKQYITARKYRNIPVGYAATDTPETHYQIATFLNCGPDEVRTDFIAFNDYSWCGPQTFSTSSWATKTQLFSNYSAPIFFSEYGCIEVQPRTFADVSPLYSPSMTPVYSGGLIYEYSYEKTINPKTGSAYGIVDISSGSVKERPDFSALQKAFKNTPLPTDNGGYSSTNKGSICPPENSAWKANHSLPGIPQGAAKYMTQGAGSGPGLKSGVNSQWKGTPYAGSWTPIAAGSGGSGSSGSGGSSPSGTAKKSAGAALRPEVAVVFGLGVVMFFGGL